MSGLDDLLFWYRLYQLRQLFRFLSSNKHRWADKATRDLRYLIVAMAPLGVIVHLALYVYQLGGWKRFLEESFSSSPHAGELAWAIFFFVFAAFWLVFPFVILIVEQLRFRTRVALSVVIAIAVLMIAVDVLVHVYGGNSVMALLALPLLVFFPMVVIGLAVTRVVEGIYEPKGTGSEPEMKQR